MYILNTVGVLRNAGGQEFTLASQFLADRFAGEEFYHEGALAAEAAGALERFYSPAILLR